MFYFDKCPKNYNHTFFFIYISINSSSYIYRWKFSYFKSFKDSEQTSCIMHGTTSCLSLPMYRYKDPLSLLLDKLVMVVKLLLLIIPNVWNFDNEQSSKGYGQQVFSPRWTAKPLRKTKMCINFDGTCTHVNDGITST